MRWSELNPEIWYLVFQALENRNDVKNICEVSTAFNALATPVLYRSVILQRSETTGQEWNVLPGDVSDSDEADNLEDSLFSRLLDDRNESLRALVRELTLGRIVSRVHIERAGEMIAQPGNPIVKLVNNMPNLERVYFRDEYPLSQVLIDAMRDHKRSPKLHILNGMGRIQLTVQAPFVKALSTSVNVHATGTGFKKQTLDLRRLFTIYPNLESLSVSINRYRTGCVRRHPRDYTTDIIPLELPGSETFPPIQSLSLSGYYLEEQEFPYWRDKFSWDRLESLSLGPEVNGSFLEEITGCVHRLKKLKVTAYCHRSETTSPQLDHFLRSFDTLESLTAKGFVPSVEAVGHHPNLKSLCLHAIEHPDRGRPVPSAQGIQILDRSCPSLQSLAIDVQQGDTWPDDFIHALATGFRNLRQLTIHVAMGLSESTDGMASRADFEASLSYEKVQEFQRRFLDWRGGPLALQMVTIYTGEDLRRFPQRTPLYASREYHCAKIFEIHFPKYPGAERYIKRMPTRSERFRQGIERDFHRLYHPMEPRNKAACPPPPPPLPTQPQETGKAS